MNLHLLPSSLIRLDIGTQDVYCLFRARNWKLDTMFPRLASLEMGGQRLKAANLKNLPPTLTTLKVAAYGETLSNRDLFADLPRGLTTLEFWFDIKDSQEDGNQLPPNLSSLSIYELRANFNWFKKLPNSVTKLDISAYAPLDWKSLPPGLVELNVGFPSTVPSSALSQLPKCLQKLNVRVKGPFKDSDMAELPRSLTCFKDFGKRLTHEGLKLAPPGLTDLSADVNVTHPDMISFFHPESVRMRLIEKKDNYVDDGNLIFLNPLPLPLTLLSLTVHYMTDELCLLLPPRLEYLELMGGNLTARGAKIFPTLKFLRRFTTTIDAIQDDVIPYLRHTPSLSFTESSDLKRDAVRLTPNSLQHLLPSSTPNEHVHTSSDAPYGVQPLKLVSDPETQPLKCIRVQLNRFEESPIFLPRYFFAVFAQLKHLDTLSIRSVNHNIEGSMWSELPSSLRTLELSVLATCPEPSKLATLPPYLTNLELSVRTGGTAPWTDQDLASLPRSLTYFRISSKLDRVTSALNQYTPPYLSEFVSGFDDLKLFETPLTRFFGPDSTSEDNQDESDNGYDS
jgi:hypothetical protein